MPDELIFGVTGGVARLTLNRPRRRNALTPELIEQLIRKLDWIDASEDLRAVVVTGAPPAFCAGFDINRIESPGSTGPAPSATWSRRSAPAFAVYGCL